MSSKTTNLSETDELLLVQALFRHGARTPLSLPPTDRYAQYDFPEGMGALSGAGKEQMFRYGQILRERYAKYLGGIKVRDIQAKSSPVKRCVESALSVLAGLFPPDESQVWSQSQPFAKHWQPIGVTVSGSTLGVPPCPEANAMALELPKSESFSKFVKENQDFLEKIPKITKSTQKYDDAIVHYDNLTCLRAYFGDSFTGPDWLGPDEWVKLKELRSFDFGLLSILPKRYFQLKTSSLLIELLTSLKRASESHTLSIEICATQDLRLIPLLHVLGFYKEALGFGSGIIVELRRDRKTGLVYVCLFDVNGDGDFAIQQLNFSQSVTFKENSTGEKCSLDNFGAALQDYLLYELN